MQFFVVCADPAVYIVKFYKRLWPLLGADAGEDILLRVVQVKSDLPVVPARVKAHGRQHRQVLLLPTYMRSLIRFRQLNRTTL